MAALATFGYVVALAGLATEGDGLNGRDAPWSLRGLVGPARQSRDGRSYREHCAPDPRTGHRTVVRGRHGRLISRQDGSEWWQVFVYGSDADTPLADGGRNPLD